MSESTDRWTIKVCVLVGRGLFPFISLSFLRSFYYFAKAKMIMHHVFGGGSMSASRIDRHKSRGATEVTELNGTVISNTVVSLWCKSGCTVYWSAPQLHRRCGASGHHERPGHKVVDITSLLALCVPVQLIVWGPFWAFHHHSEGIWGKWGHLATSHFITSTLRQVVGFRHGFELN